MEFKEPVGREINLNGELEGFCPNCLSANVYQVINPLNPNAQKLFKGKKYLCKDCKNIFDELKEDYIK